jgi:lipoprotein-anchoring transpeptidase ErfK/SrfK
MVAALAAAAALGPAAAYARPEIRVLEQSPMVAFVSSGVLGNPPPVTGGGNPPPDTGGNTPPFNTGGITLPGGNQPGTIITQTGGQTRVVVGSSNVAIVDGEVVYALPNTGSGAKND